MKRTCILKKPIEKVWRLVESKRRDAPNISVYVELEAGLGWDAAWGNSKVGVPRRSRGKTPCKTDAFGDLYKEAVIDPAKVVRTALQDAASVADLLVTTEAMVAEKPKK